MYKTSIIIADVRGVNCTRDFPNTKRTDSHLTVILKRWNAVMRKYKKLYSKLEHIFVVLLSISAFFCTLDVLTFHILLILLDIIKSTDMLCLES